MKKVIYVSAFMILLAGAYITGSRHGRQEGVRLGQSPPPVAGQDDGDRAPGTVRVSPEKQQLIGMRVEAAERSGSSYTLRAFGRIAVDENRVYKMVAPADGWIQEIQGGTTGSLVAKDQILASFYSGDLAGGQQSLFYALNTLDQYKTGKASEAQTNSILQQLRTAETSLKAFGMSEAQIRDLKETRKPARGIEIRAPVAGIIISRNVYPNLRFERNAELYRIADLSRVWILVDTYGNEASYLKPGAPAQITIPGQKKVFSAKVSEAVPLIDPGTRTLKVRLEAENPGYPFKPDMLVDVEFAIRLPAAITAPVDAVLDSGLKKTIFVERGNGLFEPREVETGWRLGNRIEITRGLAPGERIVTSGTFLLDSESRMDLAASGIGGALDKDPVTGAAVSRRKAEKAGLKRSWQGRNYYFNSRENLERFMKTPGRYLEKTGEGAMPGAVSSTPRHH